MGRNSDLLFHNQPVMLLLELVFGLEHFNLADVPLVQGFILHPASK